MKKFLPHIISALILLVLSCIFFFPQIQGKKLQQSDLIQYNGMASEINEWKEKTGHIPLWTNSMFSGMPTYQITTNNPGNVAQYIEKSFRLFISRPIGYFFACSITTYILLIFMGCSPWVAVIGAIGYSYTASILTLYEAGHSSKMRVLSFLPLITAGVILMYRKKYPFGMVLFLIGASVGILANHPQMLYYMSFPLLLFVLIHVGYAIKEKEILDFGKASGGLIIGLIIAMGCSATVILTTQEYLGDTMRGDAILEHGEEGTSSTEKGLDWEYAMQWSQNLKDVMTLVIPGAAGGGSMESSGWSKDLKGDMVWAQVLRNNNNQAPLYHGGLPFTSGPAYIGIFFIFFFILGYFIRGGKFYHWILISAIFTIFLSMGKNLEWFNRLIFDYVPLYDKFRTPNSIMPITSLLLVLGGAIGLRDFLRAVKKKKHMLQKNLLTAAGVMVGLCLVAWSVAASYGFSAPGDEGMIQQGLDINPLINARKSLLNQDAMRNIFLVILGFGILWMVLKKKVKIKVAIIILGVLVLFDVWSVGKRYINTDSFKDDRVISSFEQPRPVDLEIMKDKDPYFRVYDMSINTFNSSTSSHFYKTIGGYHAAKLQRYQDIIDNHIVRGNQEVLDMLNTKYIIDSQGQLHRNPGAFGNAWFVQELKFVQSNREEIDALNTADLKMTAIIHNEFKEKLHSNNYSIEDATVELTEYSPEKLTYKARNAGNGFIVFSEVWYGPDKGWKAFVDGKETAIIRVDYVLRGIEVPAGEHEIIMEFHPTSFYTGLTISYISSILLLIGVFGGLYLGFREEKQDA